MVELLADKKRCPFCERDAMRIWHDSNIRTTTGNAYLYGQCRHCGRTIGADHPLVEAERPRVTHQPRLL